MITRRAVLFAALAWPCAAQGLSITGKVRGTNGPLEGATVTLSSLSSGRRITQANADGEFAFPGLDNGPYQVTFEHPGYRTATVRVALGYDPDTGEVNITLQPE